LDPSVAALHDEFGVLTLGLRTRRLLGRGLCVVKRRRTTGAVLLSGPPAVSSRLDDDLGLSALHGQPPLVTCNGDTRNRWTSVPRNPLRIASRHLMSRFLREAVAIEHSAIVERSSMVLQNEGFHVGVLGRR
jgi:hypothetical protein